MDRGGCLTPRGDVALCGKSHFKEQGEERVGLLLCTGFPALQPSQAPQEHLSETWLSLRTVGMENKDNYQSYTM